MSGAGKGDKPRPIGNYDAYRVNYDEIFKPKKESVMVDTAFTVTNQLRDKRYCNGCFCVNRAEGELSCNVFGEVLFTTDDNYIVRSEGCKSKYLAVNDGQGVEG